MTLSDRLAKILGLFEAEGMEGKIPSRDDLVEHCGVRYETISRDLSKLERAGYLVRVGGPKSQLVLARTAAGREVCHVSLDAEDPVNGALQLLIKALGNHTHPQQVADQVVRVLMQRFVLSPLSVLDTKPI